ncbi:MAG: hypothetical protein MUE50_02925 [Pirellulaceae bacterium]|jgi:hypothetical protein|nr:hypothetical protein [Pirellulaceae bacterium]
MHPKEVFAFAQLYHGYHRRLLQQLRRPLEVVGSTRFLTCNHCGSRLELHRTGSATYTADRDTV